MLANDSVKIVKILAITPFCVNAGAITTFINHLGHEIGGTISIVLRYCIHLYSLVASKFY